MHVSENVLSDEVWDSIFLSNINHESAKGHCSTCISYAITYKTGSFNKTNPSLEHMGYIKLLDGSHTPI